MKRILYYLNESLEGNPGIEKKCYGQIRAFEKLGYIVDIHQFDDQAHSNRLLNNNIVESFSPGFFSRKKFIVNYSTILNIISKNKYDLIYFRYTYFSNFFFNSFLKKIKELQPNCKIILEIPTYPYDQEVEISLDLKSLFRLIERATRNKLKKYIDYFVTYSMDKEIFGADTINIQNAIDANLIKVNKNIFDSDSIHILCLANFSYWHGYDRILHGISNYKGQQSFKISFVGDGKELENLNKITKQLSLCDSVTFHGIKKGPELDLILDSVNIAVDSLGRHRSGHNYNSSLKSKEYLARGIPFIKSHKDKAIDDLNCNAILQVSADDESIDFNEVFKWYRSLDLSSNEFFNAAYEFTWEKQLNRVIEKL